MPAVVGVDLDVEAGEIVGFLGLNGAGRTTTLRMLTTLLEPTAGTAAVAGCDLRTDPVGVRRRIDYVSQSGSTAPEARAGEEVVDHARLYGMSTAEATERGKLLFRELDLDGLGERQPKAMSGGQRRRLDIAVGLIHVPELVFLDEPTTGLDPCGPAAGARAERARCRGQRVLLPLPGRGRRALRPHPGHRPRSDRGRGDAGRAHVEGRRRRPDADRGRILVQLGIFGALFVGFGLIAEYRSGVIESQRVTPASRTALLLGRVLRDAVVLLVQGTLLVLVSIPLGLRAPFLGVVLTLVVIAVLGAAFASVSYALALTLKSEDAFAPLLNAIVLPVLLLSGVLLPMTLAPGWLQTISDINPLEHVVEGTREFFVGGCNTSTAWWGAALTVLLAVLGWAFGVRPFRRESSGATPDHACGEWGDWYPSE